MPSVQSGAVLVTGAAGFIGSWTTKSLLDRGFSVRGTVQYESDGKYLRSRFQEYEDNFSYVVVEYVSVVNITLSYTALCVYL